ncbi:MAG: prepilin peptidase [Dehalococcoidales bacterium]|nr:prepilin peptidase [Dehalococcoidales bacterium]
MEIYRLIIAALFGAAIGSFLNVCIDRLPAGKSLAFPPSACDSCGHRLSPPDLVPIFSYILLRGRCRYCRQHIPLRVLVVELLSALLFALTFYLFGWSARTAVILLYNSIFVVILFIDMEHQLILNKVVYPAAIAALLILALDSLFPQAGFYRTVLLLPRLSILSGIIGAAAGFIFFLVIYLLYPRGMGEGDVKLAGLIGLMTGFPMAAVALFVGIVAGGVVAVILLVFRKAGRKQLMPYGSFLSFGAIITLFWGNNLLIWYLGLF